MDVSLTSPTGENPEEYQQRIMGDRVQRQVLTSYKEELVRAAQSTPVFQRPTVDGVAAAQQPATGLDR